jgi:Bifunctional DNA primase/polymerase, N-terminal
MVEPMLRRGRRGDAGRMAGAAAEYAAMGWPVCLGAYPRGEGTRPRYGLGPRRAPDTARAPDTGRACSCDRVGCPAPGAHPVSPAWQLEASCDLTEVGRWWRERPEANIILVTGRVFDVLDVPAQAGTVALDRMGREPAAGPVALTSDDRALFFVATRGTPDDEDEWWSCHLDCEPDSFAPVAGLRWHCRDSYVVAPPSRGGRQPAAYWIRDPAEYRLPDGLRLLELLADACDEVMR